ncbi:deoxynucleoside kinase [Aminiphilus circumscriptus]|jgi:deoxyadenosine/deoxycytidine kinase|uniref:deoxynucleoside kinase n=1 Tax=Aminiphilus circumscriptus TaxID=290732 RepID=UPI000492525A|nr:deoxynucleoside kinase [Aminiphilus circumscriptus]
MGQVQIVVEGMTASGKSTAVRLLSDALGLEIMQEQAKDHFDLMGRFSRDRRWAFPMQLNFLTTRFAHYLIASESENAILDRSIFGDRVYASLYFNLRFFPESQYQMYVSLFDFLLSYIKLPKLLVFTRCSFDETMRRLRLRNVASELGAGEEYWSTLHESYEKLLYSLEKNSKIPSLLVVDSERMNLVESEKDKEVFLNDVRNRLGR